MTDATSVRIAAAGDIHCHEANRDHVREAFARLPGTADLVLLAGDLTTHGEPEQAAVLADACRDLGLPVIAVLGNHDWHVNRADELIATLEDAGIQRPRARLDRRGAGRHADRHRRGQGLRRRLPRLAPARLRRAAAARRLPPGRRGGRGGGRRPARGRALPGPHRAPALRADPRDARGRAARRSGRCWAATASPSRSPSTSPISCCTATRTPGRSAGRSARCPSSTSRCR